MITKNPTEDIKLEIIDIDIEKDGDLILSGYWGMLKVDKKWTKDTNKSFEQKMFDLGSSAYEDFENNGNNKFIYDPKKESK